MYVYTIYYNMSMCASPQSWAISVSNLLISSVLAHPHDTTLCIYTLSFQTLQICRVQTKTLGLAVIMLKTLGLSQKTRVFLQTVRIRYSACFQHFSYFALLHHMFLRCSSIQPYRQETTSTLYIWSREKRNPNMEKYGSGIQASSKPCSTRDLPVSTRVFLRNTQGL